MQLVTDIGPFYIQFSGVISPDRKYYYTVLNKIEKRDFKTNRVLATAEDLDKSYYTIQVSSDGKKVYLGGGGDTILIYDTDTMKLLKRLDTPGDAVLTHFRVQHR
jgi:WD40 repeat protein